MPSGILGPLAEVSGVLDLDFEEAGDGEGDGYAQLRVPAEGLENGAQGSEDLGHSAGPFDLVVAATDRGGLRGRAPAGSERIGEGRSPCAGPTPPQVWLR